jgi:hypothetical protein
VNQCVLYHTVCFSSNMRVSRRFNSSARRTPSSFSCTTVTVGIEEVEVEVESAMVVSCTTKGILGYILYGVGVCVYVCVCVRVRVYDHKVLNDIVILWKLNSNPSKIFSPRFFVFCLIRPG